MVEDAILVRVFYSNLDATTLQMDGMSNVTFVTMVIVVSVILCGGGRRRWRSAVLVDVSPLIRPPVASG